MLRSAWLRMVPVAALVWLGGVASAQTEEALPVAYVTAVTNDAAFRVDAAGEAVRVDTASYVFSDANNGLRRGERLRTTPDGSAVLALFDYGVVVHLEHSSELALLEAPADSGLVPVVLMLYQGRAFVVRRETADGMLVVGCESRNVAGYTLSRGASLVVRAEAPGATFAVAQGRAKFFFGRVPPTGLNVVSGDPDIGVGIMVEAGESITTLPSARPVDDLLLVPTASTRFGREMLRFGVASSGRWVERAEQGDFTPVRGTARGEPGLIGQERQEAFVLDQPRTVAAPAPQTRVRILGRPTRLTAAQASLESQIPSAVVTASRYLNARFVGSTSGLRINREIRRNIVFGK
jgi:hypothetical protein